MEAAVRSAPDGYTLIVASSTGLGLASPAAVCMQMIAAATGIRMNQVPYKGGAPLVADMVAGHVKVGFADSTSAFGPIQSGKLKVLASCAGSSDVIPSAPSFKEQGVDYDFLWRRRIREAPFI